MGRRFGAFTYLLLASVDIWLGFDFWHAGYYFLSLCFFALSLWFMFSFSAQLNPVMYLTLDMRLKIENAAKEAKRKMEEPNADPNKIHEDLRKRIEEIKNERP